jgi:cbb3-type cytochrome oxidase subunit 3
MRAFWSKIGLGALAIFLVGMMLITLGRTAKNAAAEAITTALASTSQVASASSDIPFRLEGEKLGIVRHAAIQRQASGTLPEVNLTVDLNDADAGRQLRDCILIPEHHRDFDFDRGFECAQGMTGDLVKVGRIYFAPIDLERPIMVAPDVASEMRKGDPFEATADAGGAVKVSAQGDGGGEMVRLLADRHGANIRINDELGRAVLRLFADSTGATLRVKGKNGKDLVKLDAGDGKFSLSVDTTAAH